MEERQAMACGDLKNTHQTLQTQLGYRPSPITHFKWQRSRKPTTEPTNQQKPGVGTVCQVPGCKVELAAEGKAYCVHRHICRHHMQADSIHCPITGQHLRFCMQCGKLEPLVGFDGNKRSCRVALQKRRQRHRTIGHHSSCAGPVDADEAAGVALAGAQGTAAAAVPMALDAPCMAAATTAHRAAGAPFAAAVPFTTAPLAAAAAAAQAAAAAAAQATTGRTAGPTPTCNHPHRQLQQQSDLQALLGQLRQSGQLEQLGQSVPSRTAEEVTGDNVDPYVAACLSMAHELFPMLQLPELVVLLVALVAMNRLVVSSSG